MNNLLDRRTALQLSMSAAMCLGLTAPAAVTAASATAAASASAPLLRRTIPASGEQIPLLGLGTNNYSPTTPEERAARRAVLERLTAAGLRVIDTAPAYRESERVLGELLGELGNRPQAFIATKVTAASGTREEAVAMMDESMRRLRTGFIELMQVHNLIGTAVLLPLLREQVAAKKIRYLGVTTSRDDQYPEVLRLLRSERLDFIQIDYSLGNRGAADEILPLAADKGVAVLINQPFGGRRGGGLFARVAGQSLPAWAAEAGAQSWGQFFLKYVVSHPAVTCAIPGMTKIGNLEDNLGAARGTLPEAALRARMEAFWDALPG